MKHMRFILLASLLSCMSLYAQYTQIPDEGFEQTLISLGIDSEGVLDGQVLTSDIENLEELDLGYITTIDMYNLIGLEDFTSLKKLSIENLHLYFDELDLAILPQLEVYKSTGHIDWAASDLEHVIFSNNPNLKKIRVEDDWVTRSIDLRGSDMMIDSLNISYSPGSFGPTNTSKLCVKVTDPIAATNKTGVYANWKASNIYYTTEDCSLSVNDYKLASLKVYPNPSQDYFQLDTPLDITSLNLYDISGKEVKNYEQMQDTYNISDLSPGIYLLEIKFETGDVLTKKLIKE